MKFKHSALLIAGFFLASAEIAAACSCAYGGYSVSEFLEKSVVFEGRVLSSKWLGDAKDRPPIDDAVTEFELGYDFKGNVPAFFTHITVQHGSYEAGCGISFPMGSQEIIVAEDLGNGRFTTNYCSMKVVPQMTLIDYLENGTDTYIPDSWNCTDAKIADKNDPDNCHFLSDAAANERRKRLRLRQIAIWDKLRVEKAER